MVLCEDLRHGVKKHGWEEVAVRDALHGKIQAVLLDGCLPV
jgi:hypothetical protein